MVSLSDVKASNAQIPKVLPANLIAVFVGATKGIGEIALKAFVKQATSPRIYFIGRTQSAGDRIKAECKTLNPSAELIYISADISLIKGVDEVCLMLREKERHINILFQSQGMLDFESKTPEGLKLALSLMYYSRLRFITNLLPHLQRAPSLRRVISVACAGLEGKIYTNDLAGDHIPFLHARAHLAAIQTLALEVVAQKAPNVTFVHNFPGAVDTGSAEGMPSRLVRFVGVMFKYLGWLWCMPFEECGERHLFLMTSGRFPAKDGGKEKGNGEVDGVPVKSAVGVARGVDGREGSGVYSVDSRGDGTGAGVEKVLAGHRAQKVPELLWDDLVSQWVRITGKEVV